jgi:dTDP-4-amino-4,6-dideoxygalactose transaminase
MKVSILQPNYIPWIGYFEIIKNSDIFVFYDDAQYTRSFIKLLTIPDYSGYNGHLFYIQILKRKRASLIKYLNDRSISTVFHYVPLHNSKFGKKNSVSKFKMNNTNNAGRNLLRLPLHKNIKIKQIKKVTKEICNFFKENNTVKKYL